MVKKVGLFISILLLVIVIGKNLNPFDNLTFDYHDITQAARVKEFTLNLEKGKIPPRISPNLSFKLGYPVFNYYAPFSYWATSFIHMLGFDIPSSIELSFLLALCIGFVGLYFFLSLFFSFAASLAASFLFITSPYLAVEIFVRGNLGEVWFIAILPWVLYLLYLNAQKFDRVIFFVTVLFLSFLFTTHNIFAVISLPLLLIYIFLFSNKKRNLFVLGLGLALSAYFILPAIIELSNVYTSAMIEKTSYLDHFLCLYQIWDSPWGFGGSSKGCIDGMSFKLGKLQIIISFLGLLIFLFTNRDRKKIITKIGYFFLGLAFFSLFLTLPFSIFFWNLFRKLLALFQFPWRFLLLLLFSLPFFISFFLDSLKKYRDILALILIALTLFINNKYFYKKPISTSDYKKLYLTDSFVREKVVYAIPDYLPKSADLHYWLSLKNKSLNFNKDHFKGDFIKEAVVENGYHLLPVHYVPYWSIYCNGKKIIPMFFDKLGRPLIKVKRKARIRIVYSQTSIEKISNILSLTTLVFLLYLLSNAKYFQKRKKS